MTTVSELPSPLTLLPAPRRATSTAMNHLLTGITPYVARICRPSPTTTAPTPHAGGAARRLPRPGFPARTGGEFYGWVRSVTVREALRTAKRYGEERCCSQVESRQEAKPLDAVHISDVLERLSQAHRQVLTLRAYGLNEEEMAEVLALPVGKRPLRLFRARRRFQEAWQPSAA
ncbi:hypothetical protein GCM10023238_29950 [Streptomyces heliomycini]